MKKIILQCFLFLLVILLIGCQKEINKPTITVEDYDVEIVIDDFAILNPQVNGDIENPKFIFETSDTNVFTIDENGTITPVSIGSGSVTITLSGTNISITVNVKVANKLVKLSFVNDDFTIKVNETLILELLEDNLVCHSDITWVSSNTSVATVDEDGVVTALAVGTTTITATTINSTISVEIIVNESDINQAVTSLTIYGDNYIEIEKSTTFSAIANINEEVEVTWTSSNEDVAMIINNDYIMGVSEGSAIITATYKNNPLIKAIKTINVTKPTLKISFNPSTVIPVGATTYNFVVRDSKGLAIPKANCIITSSNENVATVLTNGSINAKAVGTAVITITYQEITGSVVLTVVAAPAENLRNTIVQIAINENGYIEGYNNDTKYGDWYGMSNQPWCAMFVSWAADQAGIPQTIIPKYAAVALGLSWYQQKGPDYYKSYEETLNNQYIPQCGDIVFFKSNGASHTGLVIKTVEDILYTIEGNTSNKVALRCYYYKNYNKITGYGLPAYAASSAAINDFDVTAATFGGGSSTV